MEKFLFKKIEMWIVLLVVLMCFLAALAFGFVVRLQMAGSERFGNIGEAALFLAEIPINLRKAIAGKRSDLEAAEQRFEGRGGLTVYQKENELDSNNRHVLVSRYDADRVRSVVELLDLREQRVVHTWMPDIDAINGQVEKVDEFEYLERDDNQGRYRIMHPLLLLDGSLVFHSTRSPLVKIDACSSLVFQNTSDVFHHSAEIDDDGNIWVPTAIYPPTIEVFGDGYTDEAITKVSPEGEILYQQSVTEILFEHDLMHEVYTYDLYISDPVHLNDIEPVNADGPYWKKGDVFISLGHLNIVALFRPATKKILWWTQQKLNHQHDVDIITDHEISIFDNNRIMSPEGPIFGGDIVNGSNEIQIYNFETGEIRSLMKDALRENDVRTISQGLSRVLPDGHIFIEETNYGRLLELDSKGQLVWEYVNRASDGMVYMMNWSRIIDGDEAAKVRLSLADITCERLH